ncbi:YraN family protein [Holospora curviuscula]|uniref:Uncharacterized protein n=1 Tax=Holospora curviuscula TaxID=1082868 RepID=A0A2S5R7B0_9PROT|nr:YraN family protein [Holospora curviuscula]PPE03177.1 hypothetical protein HCUR_01377 [Holospora curviuscula]
MEYIQRILLKSEHFTIGLGDYLIFSSYKKGLDAEQKVLDYFLAQGYVPIHRRLRTPFGELDLVCSKGYEILFIEVKYRTKLLNAREALGLRQKKRILQASQWLINQMNEKYDTCQVCVVVVSGRCIECYFNACVEGYDTV